MKSLSTCLLLLIALLGGSPLRAFAQPEPMDSVMRRVDREVRQAMRKGNIPGLSLVLVQGSQQRIRSYGYADLARKRPVTAATLFEIGSCTKAFTALSVAGLIARGQLALDDPVAAYLPWFRATYKGKPAVITIGQLLHHTSGIPWSTIARIPQTNRPDALRQTVRQLAGQTLDNAPGKEFRYATINYDVLALIIQTVTGRPFEDYLQANVLDTLQLYNTTIGRPKDSTLKAAGYKTAFFAPRLYEAPVYRGNNAAGYVHSNAPDMLRWLKFQMGLLPSHLQGLAALTHQRDETVPLHGMSAYAMGWNVSLSGNGEIYHDGLNPNFTAYVTFRPEAKIGVVVLANANSGFTSVLGSRITKLLAGEEIKKDYYPGDQQDKTFSTVAVVLAVYLLTVATFLGVVLYDAARGKRKREAFSARKLGQIGLALAGIVPFLYGLYILPGAMFDFTWEALLVWTAGSVPVAVALVLAAMAVSYLAYLVSLWFPEPDKYRRIVPGLLLFSILSSLANMLVIILITWALDSDAGLEYLVFYYLLTLSVYLLGRRYVQVNLIRLSRELTFELRNKLLDKIFATSLQQFEKLDRGRVYTAVNDDVDSIGQSLNTFVVLVTSVFTVFGAFLYLAAIAFWATLLSITLILALLTLYSLVISSTNKYYEQARDSRNVFMRLINGLIDGFKEVSLNRSRKRAYKQDVVASADEYRRKVSIAGIRFVNASLLGEVVLIAILGLVAFAFPKAFPGIPTYTLMSFVVLLLYLIGPINTILNSIPAVMGLRIAWNRIGQFLNEIPANAAGPEMTPLPVPSVLESIRAEGVQFAYSPENAQHPFTVGPIDLEVARGEILFIIGGNGSGKTTLVKLLTGLYAPDSGNIRINGQVVPPGGLGEYFSTVFSPAHLFEKLYTVDAEAKPKEVGRLLELLNLENKVTISGNRYSTIDLSGGQRKRLALLQCYLEDAPICLFDEWAADQDPEYRHFFYRTLLPQMREQGKIVIAVTHDDHYFDVADRIIKMDQGKPRVYTQADLFTQT